MVQFRIPAEALTDMEVLRRVGSDKLAQLASAFKAIEPTPLRPKQLRETACTVLGTGEEAEGIGQSVVRLLLALYGLLRQRSLNPKSILDGLRDGIGKSDWNEEAKNEWKAVEPQIEELLSIEKVGAVSKALALAYEYANLYESAQIITDIRPVYNEDGSDIQGSIVSYTLRMNYDDAEGNHTLSIAMDEKDIQELMGACERAQKKSQRAKRLMEDVEVPTMITGEHRNGTD